MGYVKEYDDLKSDFLEEIVIFKEYQAKGLGALFIKELESHLLEMGVRMIEILSINDNRHMGFYEKLSFTKASNLKIISKFI